MIPKITPVNEKLHDLLGDKFRRLEKEYATEEYLLYRKNWAQYPKENIVDIPLNLDIELTNACNLKCLMCPRTIAFPSRNDINIGFMDEKMYYKIIDEASELGIPAVKLAWRGESTLHPQLPQFIEYAKKRNILDVLLNTNAVLLTEELSSSLIGSGLDSIIFSFDSPVKEVYEKIRVGAKYEDVFNNIKRFNSLKTSGKPFTRVTMVRMDENQNALSEFIRMFEDVVDHITYTDAFYLEKESCGDEVLDSDKFTLFSCAQPWQRMAITWDGNAYPCCMDMQEKYCLGTIADNTVISLWRGEKMNRLRELHLANTWMDLKVCRDCQKTHSITGERLDGLI